MVVVDDYCQCLGSEVGGRKVFFFYFLQFGGRVDGSNFDADIFKNNKIERGVGGERMGEIFHFSTILRRLSRNISQIAKIMATKTRKICAVLIMPFSLQGLNKNKRKEKKKKTMKFSQRISISRYFRISYTI